MEVITDYSVMVKMYRGEKEGDRWVAVGLPLPYHYWTTDQSIAEEVAKQRADFFGKDKVKIKVRQRTKENFQEHLKKRFPKYD